jgi:hypothetical protein
VIDLVAAHCVADTSPWLEPHSSFNKATALAVRDGDAGVDADAFARVATVRVQRGAAKPQTC